MGPSNKSRIVVVGAGIVGISSALYLQKAGFEVTLVDRDAPGNGASFGNAGAIAPHAFVPVNSPSIPKRLLKLMFASGSPLSVNWSYAPRMMPWLLSFLRHCTESEVTRISEALHTLLSRNIEFALPLFKESGADSLIRSGGYLHLYENEADYRTLATEIALYKRLAPDAHEIDAAEIKRLEPNLARVFTKALYFADALHYRSPVDTCTVMARHFAVSGGTVLRDEIKSIEKRPDGEAGPKWLGFT